jgi:hypothetical protein
MFTTPNQWLESLILTQSSIISNSNFYSVFIVSNHWMNNSMLILLSIELALSIDVLSIVNAMEFIAPSKPQLNANSIGD